MINHYIAALNNKEPLTFLTVILGIPVSTIADEIGVDQSYLSRVRNGERNLSQMQKNALLDLVSRCLTSLNEHDDPLVDALIDFGEELS